MSKIYFEVEGGVVIKHTPIPEIGENAYKTEVIMTKDVFRKCYKKWIEQEPKEIGHCKDCKYFEYDSVAKVDGIPLIVAHEICNKWGDGCKTKEDGYCFLFEQKESEE